MQDWITRVYGARMARGAFAVEHMISHQVYARDTDRSITRVGLMVLSSACM